MMRYNVHQLQLEIEQLDTAIKDEQSLEDRLHHQVDCDIITIIRGNDSEDGWDYYEANKAAHHLPEDNKSFQRQRNVRLRLEKQRRILLQRIKKIQNLKQDSINSIICEM